MYNHKNIEKKWQNYWYTNNVFKTTESDDKAKNIYILDMFPYPSGSGLHVGHIEGYTASDVYSRFKKLQGYNVLHPIGWDAFGLPAEQYAILTGNHPQEFTQKNIANFKKQLKSVGFSFDFDKEVNTSDPNYYKWTQWIFLQMYKNNLAEYKEINVNWCQELGTVLANEEVLQDENGNDISERGGFPVVQKPMKQWVLKITKYAKRLLDDLEEINWSPSIKSLQKNWIGLEKKNGKTTTNLRDWIFSRQRFWGEPFPIMFDKDGEVYLVENLPVTLPTTNKKIQPSGDGTSPLTNFKDWINVEMDGKKYVRENNTMPQWAGSCWYYLAFILKDENGYLPLNSKEAYNKFKKWLPVDLYIGGQEHAVLHLLYARFWHKVLYDLKIVPTKEPFFKLLNQGMILGTDGQKMSKSKKNGVSPNEVIEQYGADALRMYELFMGAIWDDKPWNKKGIVAIRKWQEKIFDTFSNAVHKFQLVQKDNLQRDLHITIKEVTDNIQSLKFNVAISKLMVLTNLIRKQKQISLTTLKTFLILLTPFAPHIANELLSIYFCTNEQQISWPKHDEELTKHEEVTIPIQVLGKLRGTLVINLNKNHSKDQIIELAKKIENVQKYINNKKIKKVIYIENKIINFIV